MTQPQHVQCVVAAGLGAPGAESWGDFGNPTMCPAASMCAQVGGEQLSSWEATAPPGWVGAAQVSPWRGEGQIESHIATCLLHLSYLFTQHFAELKFKVLPERPDNESKPVRIQSFHYGACKRTCPSSCFFWFPVASLSLFIKVL